MHSPRTGGLYGLKRNSKNDGRLIDSCRSYGRRVYFDTNRTIREAFGAAEFPAPDRHLVIHEVKDNNHGEAALAPPAMQTHA
jgi:hypothetical protein